MPTDTGPVPKPALLRVCEAAVAAGACGRSVTLYFQDFPAPERAVIWNWFARRLGVGQIAHVSAAGEVGAVAGRLEDVRLVLVHDPRAHAAVARVVTFAHTTSGRVPAVLSAGPAADLDDDPGATLVAHGHADTVARATAWVVEHPSAPDPVGTPPAAPPAFDPRLDTLCRPVPGGWATRLRDTLVLRGLLAGAWLLRTDGPTPDVRVRPDYERVWYLLADPAFSPADDPGQPLAAAMVGRANAFLAHCQGIPGQAGTPGTATRQLISDLGDPTGPVVRRLIGALLADPDGFATFRTVGVSPGLQGPDWPTRDPRSLAGHLQAWSPKQVRTTFERLHREGLVASVPRALNQLYQYVLPDRLRPPGSAFLRLPEPAALEGIPLAPAGPPGRAGETPDFQGESTSLSVAGPPALTPNGEHDDT